MVAPFQFHHLIQILLLNYQQAIHFLVIVYEFHLHLDLNQSLDHLQSGHPCMVKSFQFLHLNQNLPLNLRSKQDLF